MLRGLLEGKGQGRGVNVDSAAREVAKQLVAKWFHDNVYYKSLNTVTKKIIKFHGICKAGKRKKLEGKLESSAYKQLVEVFHSRKQLFDIYPEQKERIAKCQEEWGGLRMTDRDKAYYEDQKGQTKLVIFVLKDSREENHDVGGLIKM